MRTSTTIRWAAAIATLALVLVPTATAHPASWQASGTASVGVVTFDITFFWGGSDTILQCGGGGCLGVGDGFYSLSINGVDGPGRNFVATEDGRNQVFTSDEDCADNLLQRIPAYSLQGPGVDLTGTYEFCWGTFVEHIVMDGTVDGFTVHIEK